MSGDDGEQLSHRLVCPLGVVAGPHETRSRPVADDLHA
jgi:hypothetical protein